MFDIFLRLMISRLSFPLWWKFPVPSTSVDNFHQLHDCQTTTTCEHLKYARWKPGIWIRTPQVPGSRSGWHVTFYRASDWLPQHHRVERSLVCVCGSSRKDFPSRLGLIQDFKLGSCIFECDVPHQLIPKQQVDPVSVYCDGVGCRVLCLRHGIPVWQHIGQSATATSRHRRDMTSDVKKRR